MGMVGICSGWACSWTYISRLNHVVMNMFTINVVMMWSSAHSHLVLFDF